MHTQRNASTGSATGVHIPVAEPVEASQRRGDSLIALLMTSMAVHIAGNKSRGQANELPI